MGASASRKDDATSKQGAPTRGPVIFDQDTLRFLEGGPPPPPTETSTRLQSRCDEIFRRLTEKARTKQASRAMSTKEALDAFKAKYGESAFVKAFGDEAKYFESIVPPLTVSGTSSKFWHLGPREYDIRSEHAQEIQALVAQPTGAAILPAPGGVVALEGDSTTRPTWYGIPLTPSSARRDGDLGFWEEVVDSQLSPYQDLYDGGNWSGDTPPPVWGLIKSPSGSVRPPDNICKFYRGPLPPGETCQYKVTKKSCEADPITSAHWDRATYYKQQLAAILKQERKAFEDMCAKSEAMGNGGSGRPTRGPRQSYRPEDDYATLVRAATDKLIVEKPATHYRRHHRSLKAHLALREDLLHAIAAELGVPRCVLTALDRNGKAYLLSPVIKANLPVPGLGTELVYSNWDHTDEGWKDDPSVAIRELRLRGLIWGKLNENLPGYEWYLARDAEREHLEAYLESSLCCDRSFGDKFVFEFPIDDEAKWSSKKIKDQQVTELHHIKNHFLKGAILGSTEGDLRVEATGRDVELLRILRERWGDGLVFEHSDSSEPGRICGRFRAPDFMDRGVTYFSIDHVALGCVRRGGVLYRIVGVRGLLPQDMNFHASGYEFVKVLGLEAWVEEYLKNAYCEVGVGDLDASEAEFDYRPDVFKQGGMRPV